MFTVVTSGRDICDAMRNLTAAIREYVRSILRRRAAYRSDSVIKSRMLYPGGEQIGNAYGVLNEKTWDNGWVILDNAKSASTDQGHGPRPAGILCWACL